MSTPGHTDLVAALRQEFDDAFSRTRAARSEGDAERYVLFQAGGLSGALRLAQLAGVCAAGRVVPVPTPLGELMGLTGVRGRVVPVWRLSALLGAGPAAGGGAGAERWLALCAGAEPLALALDRVEGLLHVPPSSLHPVHGSGGSEHVRHHLIHGALHRPVVDLASLARAIHRRLERSPTAAETR